MVDESENARAGTARSRRELVPAREPGQGPRQHLESPGSAEDPREHRQAPANFVTVRQVLEKLLGLREQLGFALERARERATSERAGLVLDGWLAEERRLAAATKRHLTVAAETDPDPPDGATVLDSFVQYADLDTFEQAVAEMQRADTEIATEGILERAGRTHELLRRALDQLSERAEIPSAGELFASLAELEQGAARRRSTVENAALDV